MSRAVTQMTTFLREVAASVATQRVFSAVTVLVVAGSAVAILLTSGRSAAAEAAVLSTIDAQGTRTIAIQAKSEHPDFTSAIVDKIARIPEVEAVVGFGPVRDATAAAVPDGVKAGLRSAYGRLNGQSLWQPARSEVGAQVWASRASSETLGLPPGAGSIRVVEGPEYQVTTELDVPDFLAVYEPLMLIPADRAAAEQPIALSSIVVLARDSGSVALLTDLIQPLMADLPPDTVTVRTSEEMAALRAAVGGELTRQGRTILLGVVAAATAATLANVTGFALLRRKDLGRRRALGATRSMIVSLVIGQVSFTAVLAAGAGAVAALGWLALEGSPLPSSSYVGAVATALPLTATVAAALPAAVAARRDPIRELRVP